MYMFIVYSLVIFIISSGIGKLITKKEKGLLKEIAAPIGFIVFFAVLQLGYYPMQYLQASSNIVHIYTAIITTVFFILTITKIRKEDFSFLKRYEFYVLIILIFAVIKVLPANEAGDDSFYMPLIMENAKTENINSINPRSGWNWNVDEMYKYQGYYLFQSSLYGLQSNIFNSIDDIFVTFRTTMTFLSIIMMAIIIVATKKEWKIKGFIGVILTLFSILLIGTLELSHVYWGSFNLFVIGIPVYLLTFYKYLTDTENNSYKYLLAIIGLGLNSLASTSLFLQVFIIFSFFVYSVREKKFNILDYLIIMLPNFLYAILFINKPIFFIPVGIMYCIIGFSKRFQDTINSFINKYIYKYLFIIPFIFLILGLLLKLDFSWNIYRLSKVILIFNITMAIGITYLDIKTKKIGPLEFAFVMFILFFFNPLVAPFVSKYFTSEVVYYRLFYITKNPVMIILIFYRFYLYIKDKNKVLEKLYIAGICLLLLRYSYILAGKTILEPTYYKGYNYILRQDQDSKELGQFLRNNEDKYEGNNVVSIYFSPRQYSLNYYLDNYRYPNDTKYINEENDAFIKFLYYNDDANKEDMYNFKNKMIKESTNLVITYTDKTGKIDELVDFDFEKIYKNSTYTAYKFNYNKK